MSEALRARVQNYLGNGGLFNPELMEHDKVRELICDLAKALPQVDCVCSIQDGLVQEWMSKVRAVARSKGVI